MKPDDFLDEALRALAASAFGDDNSPKTLTETMLSTLKAGRDGIADLPKGELPRRRKTVAALNRAIDCGAEFCGSIRYLSSSMLREQFQNLASIGAVNVNPEFEGDLKGGLDMKTRSGARATLVEAKIFTFVNDGDPEAPTATWVVAGESHIFDVNGDRVGAPEFSWGVNSGVIQDAGKLSQGAAGVGEVAFRCGLIYLAHLFFQDHGVRSRLLMLTEQKKRSVH